jgi:hypothetical protein
MTDGVLDTRVHDFVQTCFCCPAVYGLTLPEAGGLVSLTGAGKVNTSFAEVNTSFFAWRSSRAFLVFSACLVNLMSISILHNKTHCSCYRSLRRPFLPRIPSPLCGAVYQANS